MKPEAQRIAISKALGYKELTPCDIRDPQGNRLVNADGDMGLNWKYACLQNKIPDYLNDLNAMRNALLTLPRDTPWSYYLSQVIWEDNPSRLVTDMDRAQASPAQIARAFLEIKKLWKP